MLDFWKLYFPSATLQIFPRSLNIFSLETAIRTTLRRSYPSVLIFYQSFILHTVRLGCLEVSTLPIDKAVKSWLSVKYHNQFWRQAKGQIGRLSCVQIWLLPLLSFPRSARYQSDYIPQYVSSLKQTVRSNHAMNLIWLLSLLIPLANM